MKKIVCFSLALLILTMSLLSCSQKAKVDYLQEHINMSEKTLDKLGYTYTEIYVDENDYYLIEPHLEVRELIVVIEIDGKISEYYSNICNIIQCLEDVRVPHHSEDDKNPYMFHVNVKHNDDIYSITDCSLYKTSGKEKSAVCNTIVAKGGENLTKTEQNFIGREIEEIFKEGSLDAILNDDENFEEKTYNKVAQKYNITASNAKKYYDNFYFDKYH